MKHADILGLLMHIEKVVRADPGQADRLIAMTKASAPIFYEGLLGRQKAISREALPSLPDFRCISAAQFTLYDNWLATGGRRPRRGEKNARATRWKAQLQVWTIAPGASISTQNVAATLTFALMDAEERPKRMAIYANPKKSNGNFVITRGEPVSAEWGQFAASVLSAPDEFLCGPGYSTAHSGTNFLLGCIAVAREADLGCFPDDTQVEVMLPGGRLSFHNFTSSYAGGKPLSGNAVRISRLALADEHPAWRTGVIYREASANATPELKVADEVMEHDVPY